LKRKNLAIFSILIIVLIILAGTLVYFTLPEEDKEKKIDETTIDDRISPGTNQGLTVEILRIRHRELMDKMTNIGTSWKNTPSFYWNIKVDKKESTSEGNVGLNGIYETWDTILWESRHIFYIEEEQDESNVKISIIEKEKSGLFNTQDIEKETIKVVYDYRTGRWTGDDYLRDNDGYGHYLGETFEVWFNIYQSADLDRDYIPYWVEVNVLNTDPYIDDSELDPDNDGIPTVWEWRWDYDPFIWDDHRNLDPDIDGIENIEEYQMRKYFANPYQPDIYIETDGMEKKGLLDVEHVFHTESQQMIIERFAQHGINVYIDDGWMGASTSGNGGGQKIPFIDSIDENTGGQIYGFYNHYFSDDRKGIFRYVVIANKKGWCTPCIGNAYDTILVGNGLEVSLKRLVFSPRFMRVTIAKGVLHELGHSMGLMPWGFYGNDIMSPTGSRWPTELTEEEYDKYLNDYHSIMNYKYIWGDRKLIDFSDGSNGEYDQNDWEYIYLPTFQVDAIAFEEPNDLDSSFEDIETVEETRELIVKGWKLNEKLTEEYNSLFLSSVNTPNKENEIAILVNDNESRNIRVYIKPLIGSTPTIWSLIAEGMSDSDGNLNFYSQQEIIQEVKDQIKTN